MDLAAIIIGAAAAADVPERLLSALIDRESGGDPFAVGSAGEIGLGQLKPATAAELGVNPWLPADNAAGAARYLRQQYDATGNWTDALRAYNAGPTGAANNPAAGREYAQSVLTAAGMAGDAPAGGEKKKLDGIVVGGIKKLLGMESTTVLSGDIDAAGDWWSRWFNASTPAVVVLALLLFGLGVFSLVMAGKAALPKVGA